MSCKLSKSGIRPVHDCVLWQQQQCLGVWLSNTGTYVHMAGSPDKQQEQSARRQARVTPPPPTSSYSLDFTPFGEVSLTHRACDHRADHNGPSVNTGCWVATELKEGLLHAGAKVRVVRQSQVRQLSEGCHC